MPASLSCFAPRIWGGKGSFEHQHRAETTHQLRKAASGVEFRGTVYQWLDDPITKLRTQRKIVSNRNGTSETQTHGNSNRVDASVCKLFYIVLGEPGIPKTKNQSTS